MLGALSEMNYLSTLCENDQSNRALFDEHEQVINQISVKRVISY